ncbi:MAG: hypothetical protein HY914_14590 [Desulfomonile tiedjei]|nr:hypothetical protein [Desulfomonile tiedjei]
MNIPEIFLREFWELWPMTRALLIGSLIGLVVRLASNGGGTLITPTKSYPELAAFSKDDQLRLLREACREAFSALSFVPILVFLASWWVGAALLRTLVKVTAPPEWVVILLIGLFFGLFSGLGYWLARRLEAHRVRPFLKKLIDVNDSNPSKF